MIIVILTLFTQFALFQTVPMTVPMDYGDVFRGEVMQNKTAFQFEFDGRAGDIILIDMLIPVNTRLDASLRLKHPDGELVIANDDWGTGAHIGPLTLTQDGDYHIEVTAFEGEGPFILFLTNTDELTPIAFDKPLEVGLDSALPLLYLRFDNTDADMLRLETRQTESPGTRPTLRVFDLDGNSISNSAYFTETGIDPMPAAQNTTYIIALQQNLPQSAQSRLFDVSIAPSDVVLIRSGDNVIGSVGDVHFFAAEAGQQMRVQFSLLEDAPSPDFNIRSIDGAHFLIYATGDALTDFSATLHIPATMLYAIEVTDASGGDVGRSYQVAIDLVE